MYCKVEGEKGFTSQLLQGTFHAPFYLFRSVFISFLDAQEPCWTYCDPRTERKGDHLQGEDGEARRSKFDKFIFRGVSPPSFLALGSLANVDLNFVSLPLNIDEPTLAALVSPYYIKSSRFFQTKLSDPPRIIAFVR